MSGGALIGLAGLRRSGKTTFAEALIADGWHHDSFAAPIRQFMCRLFDIDLIDLEAIKEQRQVFLGGRTPRQVMQRLGTEWMRDYCGEDVWINALMARIRPAYSSGRRIVVSDVRFENEARFIRSMGGVVIWLSRPDLEREADDHSSESGLPAELIDHILVNDRDPEYLRALARAVARSL